VKSDGEFEDILAAERPDVWVSHRPAKGGEAGEMLAKIIERAAALKSAREETPKKAAAVATRKATRAAARAKPAASRSTAAKASAKKKRTRAAR
jgi:hypothetical protein